MGENAWITRATSVEVEVQFNLPVNLVDTYIGFKQCDLFHSNMIWNSVHLGTMRLASCLLNNHVTFHSIMLHFGFICVYVSAFAFFFWLFSYR